MGRRGADVGAPTDAPPGGGARERQGCADDRGQGLETLQIKSLAVEMPMCEDIKKKVRQRCGHKDAARIASYSSLKDYWRTSDDCNVAVEGEDVIRVSPSEARAMARCPLDPAPIMPLPQPFLRASLLYFFYFASLLLCSE